jgi:hypothetical protein
MQRDTGAKGAAGRAGNRRKRGHFVIDRHRLLVEDQSAAPAPVVADQVAAVAAVKVTRRAALTLLEFTKR